MIKLNIISLEKANEFYRWAVVSHKLLKFATTEEEALELWSKRLSKKIIEILLPIKDDENFDDDLFICEMDYAIDLCSKSEDNIKMFGPSPFKSGWFRMFTKLTSEIVNESC